MNYSADNLGLSDLESQYNLPSGLLSNVMNAESSGNPAAVSPKGATGLFQLMPDTARQYGVDPKDPYESAEGAARLLSDLSKKYDGNTTKMLAAYNWGQGNVDRQGLDKAPEETQNYVNKVLGNMKPTQAKQSPSLIASIGNMIAPAAEAADYQPKNTEDIPHLTIRNPNGQDNSKLSPEDQAIEKWRSYSGANALPAKENKVADNTEQATSPEDQAIAKWRSYSQPAVQQPTNQDVVASQPQQAAAPPADKFGKWGPKQLQDLKNSDPALYNAYLSKAANNAGAELETGLGNYPRSIGRAIAAVSPSAYNALATSLPAQAYMATTGQQIPPNANALQQATEQRNAAFQQQYGNDPNAGFNRVVGEMAPTLVGMGAIGKVAGATADTLGNAVPAAQGALNFLGGAYNGGKLGQYAASGTNAALQAIPLTAQMNASSNTPVGKQTAQNAVMSGLVGAAAPAVYDAGEAIGNKLGEVGQPAKDVIGEKSKNVIENLAGGPIQNADLKEYVPGSKTTLAKAAAYAGDPNAGGAAALEKVLSESKQGSESLYNPAYKQLEQANNQARRNYILDLAGSPDDISTIQAARSSEASDLMGNEAERLADRTIPKGTVWQDTEKADPKAALRYIKSVRGSAASGNSGLQARFNTIEDLLKKPQAQDPQYIYESILKPQINDALDSINPYDATRAKASEYTYLRKMKDILGDTIQDAAPKFNEYRQAYADKSNAIERLQALQSLNLVNPEADTSYPTLNKVNAALKKIDALRQPKTNSTMNFKVLTDDDVDKLVNLQKDLEREQAAQNLLQTKGSPTSQNSQFNKKVAEQIGAEKHQWPKNVGQGFGAMAGEAVGTYLGHPWVLGSPLAYAGAKVGGNIGEKIGESMAQKTNLLASGVNDMLLQPQNYLSAAGSSPLQQTIRPEVMGTINKLAPYAGQGIAGQVSGR